MRTSASSGATIVILLVAAACSPRDARVLGDSSANVPAPKAGTFAVADFQRLRWIEGPWVGLMSNGSKFYEQYHFLDDTTIVKYGFPDSTFAKPSDSSRVQLRGGTVTDESVGSRYVATRLDSAGADFAPERGAANHFTWAAGSPTTWNATIRWTDKDGRPQSVVYALHKFAR